LGDVFIIALDTNFAFNHLSETRLESGAVKAGNFAGIQRPTADIGGFKIEALEDSRFTIDSFTFGVAQPRQAFRNPVRSFVRYYRALLSAFGISAVALGDLRVPRGPDVKDRLPEMLASLGCDLAPRIRKLLAS
jgi:hypothetical protein